MADNNTIAEKNQNGRHVFWLGGIILLGFLLPVAGYRSEDISWPVFSVLEEHSLFDVMSIVLLYPAVAGVGAIIAALFCRRALRSVAIILIGITLMVLLYSAHISGDDMFVMMVTDAFGLSFPIGLAILSVIPLVFLLAGIWALYRVPDSPAATIIAAASGAWCIAIFIFDLNMYKFTWEVRVNIIPMLVPVGLWDYIFQDLKSYSALGIIGWCLSAISLISAAAIAVLVAVPRICAWTNLGLMKIRFSPGIRAFIQKYMWKILFWILLVAVLVSIFYAVMYSIEHRPYQHEEAQDPAYHGPEPLRYNPGFQYTMTLVVIFAALWIVRFIPFKKLAGLGVYIQGQRRRLISLAAVLLLINFLIMLLFHFLIYMTASEDSMMFQDFGAPDTFFTILLAVIKTFCWVVGIYLLIPVGLGDLIVHLSKPSDE